MKKIILVALVIVSLFLYNNSGQEDVKIPDSAIRFRILANSNSVYDQNVKSRVKDKLQYELYNKLSNTKSVDEAKRVINESIPEFKNVLDTELKEEDYSYTINYGMHEFPEKIYKGITYEEGQYESLLVTLGKGQGDNFWCVLFPPLCIMEAEEQEEKTEVEYKFFIKDILEKYF